MESSSQDKNLPATAQRLKKARTDGQVPRSKDLSNLMVLGGGSLILLTLAPTGFEKLRTTLQSQLRFDNASLQQPGQMLQRLVDGFSQGLMLYLPLSTFRRCVADHNGEHKVKDFSCLDQFFAMAFAQLTYRESLRDIEVNLRAQARRLYHMGFRCQTISRNTLANANATRPWQIFADFAQRGAKFLARAIEQLQRIALGHAQHAADVVGLGFGQVVLAQAQGGVDEEAGQSHGSALNKMEAVRAPSRVKPAPAGSQVIPVGAG
mgnify:CR=1 FL=1